jgi:hypothetical protein
VHFHVCVVDGVFEAVAGDTDVPSSSPGIVFHLASAINATAVAQAQADLRRRILRAFVGRGLIKKADAKDMMAYQHSGFSVDAGVALKQTTAPRWSGCYAIAPTHPLPWTAFAERALPWCTAAPNSAASLAVTSAEPRQTS